MGTRRVIKPSGRGSPQKALLNPIKTIAKEPLRVKRDPAATHKPQKLPPLFGPGEKRPLTSVTEAQLEEMKQTLEDVWSHKAVPTPQQDVFREFVFSQPRLKAANIISREIQELKQNKASVQIALRTLAAREDSLNSIEQMNKSLEDSPDWEKLEAVKIECAEMLHAHRLLTVAAVEAIVRWRENWGLCPKQSTYCSVPFIWQDQDYIIKMRTDTDFLAESEFAKVLRLASSRDPLLTTPSQASGAPSNIPDKSYFLQRGQLVVPVPSILVKRLQFAYQVIFQDKPEEPEFDEEELLMHIVEQALDLSVGAIVEKSLESKSVHATANRWNKSLLNDTVNAMCSEIAQEAYQAASQPAMAKFQNLLVLELVETVISQELKELVRSVLSESKLNKKIDPEVAKRIYADLLETVIAELDIAGLAMNEEQAKEDAFTSKLAELIGSSLIDEWINSEQFLNLAYEAIMEEEEKQPGSPMVSAPSRLPTTRNFGRRETLEELYVEYDIGGDFSDLSHLLFEPVNVRESIAGLLLEEHYEMMPEVMLSTALPVDLLLNQITLGKNPCWFWAMKEFKVIGLLVYSENTSFPGQTVITVHHLSCISFAGYKGLLQAAEQFILAQEGCDTIRYELLLKDLEDIPRMVKHTLGSTGYSWKANGRVDNHLFVVYGKELSSPRKVPNDVRLGSVCCLNSTTEASAEPLTTTEHMMLFGNRACTLAAVLPFFGKLQKNQIVLDPKPKNTLQKELTDLLALVGSTEGFVSSCITTRNLQVSNEDDQVQRLLKKWPEVPCRESLQTASELKLKFRWTSCTDMIYKGYHYLRFRSNTMRYQAFEKAEVYVMPTSVPTVQVFFILAPDITNILQDELRRWSTDLLYKVDHLLKVNDVGFRETMSELWVPSFQLNSSGTLPWVKGFHIPPQKHQRSECYMNLCSEGARLSMTSKRPKKGLLNIEEEKGSIVSSNFIFGIHEEGTDKALECPAFVALVREQDWIRI